MAAANAAGVSFDSDDIAALTLDEWVDLAERLPASVAEESEHFELTEDWKAELARRSAAHEQSPGQAVPWEVALAEARARTRRQASSLLPRCAFCFPSVVYYRAPSNRNVTGVPAPETRQPL